MGAHVLLPLAVNNKSEQKGDSLPLLGLEPATFSVQAHLSDPVTKSHPHNLVSYFTNNWLEISITHGHQHSSWQV
jgi:hypothetical protein